MNGIRFRGFAFRENGVRARLDMARTSRRAGRAYERLHEMAAEDMLPYMPSGTGGFRERTRAANRNAAGSGMIWAGVGPMGEYLYRGKAMVDAATGRGPRMIAGVGPRFERGAKLTATDRDLHYAAAGARPAWFEYAKAMRLQRWVAEVQRVLDGK